MNCDSNFCHNQALILSDIKILHANQVFTFPTKENHQDCDKNSTRCNSLKIFYCYSTVKDGPKCKENA